MPSCKDTHVPVSAHFLEYGNFLSLSRLVRALPMLCSSPLPRHAARLLHATHPLFGACPFSPTTLFPTTTFFYSSASPRRHEPSPTPNLLSSWTYSAAQGSSHPLLPRSYPNVHILAVRTPGTIFGRAAPPCLLSSLCLSAHSCSCAPIHPLFIPLHLSCSRKPRIRHHSPTARLFCIRSPQPALYVIASHASLSVKLQTVRRPRSGMLPSALTVHNGP